LLFFWADHFGASFFPSANPGCVALAQYPMSNFFFSELIQVFFFAGLSCWKLKSDE
jgi:hypothetical protein